MSVYTVANGKGGAGKSFTAAHLADELARRGRRVLVLELDRQGDCSTWLGIEDDTPLAAVAADVLAGDATLTQAATPSPAVEGVAVVCGTSRLGADYGPSVLERVREAVADAASGWDAVVIDTAPALNYVTSAALVAADVVVAPCITETAAWRQVDELSAYLAREIAPRRAGACVDFVVPLAVDTRESLPKMLETDLRERFGDRVTPRVRRAAVVGWAFVEGRPVTRYALGTGVAFDVRGALSYVIDTTEGK